MTETPRPFAWKTLGWLLLVATILRIGTNLSRVDEYFSECLYRGTLAQAFVTGAPLWRAHLPEIPHVPGSILMGALAAPFYVLLGPTTFAMRLSGTLMHLVAVSMFFWLLHRRLGARAACWCTWLFVLAPPGLAKMSVLSYGDHIESLPFFMFAAVFAVEWVAGLGPRLLRKAFLAGIGVSLAIGFHLQGGLGIAAVTATCALLAWPRLRTGAFWKEAFLGFLPGLAAGAVIPVSVYLITGKSALNMWGRSPMEHLTTNSPNQRWSTFANKFSDLLHNGYSYSFQYPSRAWADATLILAALCAGGLLLAAARRWRRHEVPVHELLVRGGFFVVYPLLFSVVYGASSEAFRISDDTSTALEVRYAMPVMPFLLLPIGLAGARLIESRRRALAALVLVPALAVGAWGSLSTWDLPTILHEPARRGFLWERFDGHFVWGALPLERREALTELLSKNNGGADVDSISDSYLYLRSDPAEFLQLVRRFDDTSAWTWPLRYTLPMNDPPKNGPVVNRLRWWLKQMPPEVRPFAAEQMAADYSEVEVFPSEFATALLSVLTTDTERQCAVRGFGTGLFAIQSKGIPRLPRLFDPDVVQARMRELPPEADRMEVLFGLGFRIGTMLNEFQPQIERLLGLELAALPPDQSVALVRGVGAGYRLRFLRPPAADLDSPAVRHITALLPGGLEDAFRAGLGGASSAH